MDTDLLKTFLEVARTRHFGRAAENLYLTQSAVSSRIRQLEGALGVELFSRHRNNIQLTPAGEKLTPLAESSVVLEQRIRHEVSLGADRHYQLAIGATPNIWDAVLQPRMPSLLRRPGIAVSALAHSGTTLVRQILERSLDLALVFDAPKVDELASHVVMDVTLHMVASQPCDDWAVAAELGYVWVDWGTSFRMQHAQALKDMPAPVLTTNTGRIALDSIVSEGGVAYLPAGLAEPWLQQGNLHRVANAPVMTRHVYASYLQSRKDEPLILDVLQQLSQPEASA
jgi:DNA-binding transcriptional LysR family regulator